MAKYSRVHKIGKKSFRYDYEYAILEWVCKPNAEMIADNKEWQEKYGKDMWKVEDGYVVIDSVGLSPEEWEEDPDYWCGQYAYELDSEIANTVI